MRIAILVATVALAACSQQTTKTTDGNTTITSTTVDGNVTTTTASSKTTTTTDGASLPSAASLGIQPGKWETKVSITSMEIDGKSQPAPPTGQSVTSCLTPEMAAKGPGEMIKKAGVDCTSTNSTYSDGKINTQMTCKLPMGSMTSSTTGTYSPTAMTTDAEATVTGRMTIKQKIHTEARRVGECG